MRVVVVSPLEAGSHWAHALNTIKMADGFTKLGHEVTLITRRENDRKKLPEELIEMYGISDRLDWVQLRTNFAGIDVFRQGPLFSWKAFRMARSRNPKLTYARDFYFPWLCAKSGITATAESHAPPGTNTLRFRTLVKATRYPSFKLWVTISDTLGDYYIAQGVPESKITVAPDAVDLALFSRPRGPLESPYPMESINVVYAGHLYDYKGIPTILGAAHLLPRITFHLIGGWPEDVDRHTRYTLANNLDNVVLHGLRKHTEVPHYLWHADALLLPPSADHPSAKWTSPVKLGEYLASGTPVIATDIPALRDWLTDRETLFVPPDDAPAMAAAIQTLLNNRELASRLSENAINRARTLSYEERARVICRAAVGD